MCDKVVIISGPTASGKSSYAIKLAQEINGEIISVDSMQVYKGLDIGTAKITYEEMSGICHHLLDVIYPDTDYSVADFQQDARIKIAEIIARGKMPILVGGTGLYMQSVVYDYQFDAFDALDYTRYDALTLTELGERLEKMDYESFINTDKQNRRRVTHALALAEQTDKSKSEREKTQEQKLIYDVFAIALMPERVKLYENINERVSKMVAQGLIAEVDFFQNKYKLAPQVQKAIGYKETLDFLSNTIKTKDELIGTISQNTRRFAKRQCTWIRNQRIDYQCYEFIDEYHEEILTKIQIFNNN